MRPVVAILTVLVLAGCGRGSDRAPDLAGLPLAAGARIVTDARVCDPGANAYCAEDLVVVSSRYRSSEQLLRGERRELHRRGWTGANAPNGAEHAADSPDGRLHVTFATAYGDLQSIELGSITRAHPIARALSKALFERTPALSIQLQLGSS